MATYLFDANSLIRAAWDYYAHDLAPGFWEAIEDACSCEQILIPQVVIDEMTNPRELVDWLESCVTKHSIALVPSVSATSRYADVAAFVESKYETHQAAKFLEGGDPWLIAHALAESGSSIVTLENAGQPETNGKTGLYQGPPKIPFVAQQMGARSSTLFVAMRELGISLARGV